MNSPVQTIRLTKQQVDVLNSLKRKTKINQWNILCRMGFCLSVIDNSAPKNKEMNKSDGNVEIEWGVFAGDMSEIYISLFKKHKIESNSLESDSDYFKSLLSRGLILLSNQYR